MVERGRLAPQKLKETDAGPPPATPLSAEAAPTEAQDCVQRGLAKAGRKDLKGALAEFNRAIELDPTSPQAYFYRGQLEFNESDQVGSAEALAD